MHSLKVYRGGKEDDVGGSSFVGRRNFLSGLLAFLFILTLAAPRDARGTPPEPVVAVHVSELTQALETIPATSPTPTGPGTTGFEWWMTAWRYSVIPESLKEALRSDGTPFIEVSDTVIASGALLHPDGTPRYPIVISLAAEAIGNNEIAPLRDYVAAGGMLFIGSSSFTRNPDGTSRLDFALAAEMGLHMENGSLQNWNLDRHLTKLVNHRLIDHIPAGFLLWRMPLNSEEIPSGVSPSHAIHSGSHDTFQVYGGATVLATGDTGPLLAIRPYGAGNFIYHADLQPLLGYGGYDSSLYAYLIYRRAIEWAFESSNLPMTRLSPWRYAFDAAFTVRHDFENYQDAIRSIESSAAFENASGARGDYYFCTGTLREEMADTASVVTSLRRAVTNYGATIGSHNGGLANPNNPSLLLPDYDYWHWGPDEALNATPPGYPNGQAYAQDSISRSFQDIEGWTAGVDNGRPGCGAAGNCPRNWVAPYFDAVRDGSAVILENLGVLSMGEQGLAPFPHATLSTQTNGRYFSPVTLPTGGWYVNGNVVDSLDMGHTSTTMRAAVDFYYDLGSLVNLYGHIPSATGNLMGDYVQYAAAKPRIWGTNATKISDWWRARAGIMTSAFFNTMGETYVAEVLAMGSTDPEAAVEFLIPSGINQTFSNLQVSINGTPAGPADFRIAGNRVKVRVGTTGPNGDVVSISYLFNGPPVLNSLSPKSATAGDPAFTLTVNGSGFRSDSVVRWNGADRPTTFISASRLTAAVSAMDIASVGTALVTVFNPAPGGGTSNALTFTIDPAVNPVPALSGLNPSSVLAGSPAFTLTVSGTGFVNSSVVRWNGTNRTTTFVSSTQLTAQILAADVAAAGTAQVTVFSPLPGGGTSNALSFSITTSSVLFSDNFSRTTLAPWTAAFGSWAINAGVLQGTGAARTYAYAYYSPSPPWNDYTVQGSVQMPAGSFGGGIGGRLDPATGARYGAWIYPTGSGGGSNLLKLWKFRTWTTVGLPMQQVNLPAAVGTGFHTLRLTFAGNRIQIYYDNALMIDVLDNNFDGRAPLLSGGISADWWTGSGPYTLSVDNVSVTGTAADNPLPALSNLNPSSANAGSPAFTLTVNGTGFVNSSVVRWNGVDRMTTFVSPTQLTAQILAADVAAAGTTQVSVFSPTPGGGTSNSLTFTITEAMNPLPALSGLSPSSVLAGSPAFTLTVSGTGFINSSVVRWNGVDRMTTFVSSTQVTAQILAADVAAAGTAQVTVFNPAPGGGISNALSFSITTTSVLFSDDFSRTTLPPWTAPFGTWAINAGVLQGSGAARTYAYAYYSPSPAWGDYSVQGSVQMPAGSFGGGIGGRLDPATGAHYAAWIYPTGSGGGSNVLKLWKFRTWTTTSPAPMQQVNLPAAVGTGFHTLRLTFAGNQIQVYYDNALMIDVLDNNFDARSPYLSGGISANWWTGTGLTLSVDNISVTGNLSGNPLPSLSGLNPASVNAGSPDFTLTVSGTGFVNSSVVRWNGVDRMTTFVSSTQVTAQILAADVAAAGTAQVTVFNPAPGGGTSNSLSFTINAANNPVPTLSGLNPASVNAGNPDFTLTVNGTGFINSSVVRWNGVDRMTTFVSSTQVTAQILAADVAAAGTAQVTVFNPAPGGGISNALSFTINAANNPVPTLSGLNPASVNAGNPDFTLTVSGTGFINSSVIRWNGTDRMTTFVSSTQVTAQILAADVAAAGTAQVTVFNPAPGGGISNALSFSITTNSVLFSDDFNRTTLPPWTASFGTWAINAGVLQGSGAARTYAYAYYSPSPVWGDYSVQGSVQMPAGSFGGGIGGRLDPATGAHYGAWIYPTGSGGGSNVLKLWKFRTWTTSSPAPMQQVNLPAAVGTGFHTLRLTFAGNRIQVYYDNTLMIDVMDNNFDARPAILSGGISADWWTGTGLTLSVDNVSVTTP